MSEHTPGPWEWETVEQEGGVAEHSLRGPDVLCRYWYDKPPSADARLIQAAPDLLEAAMLVAEGTAVEAGTTPLRMKMLRTAIKKATE